jgi:hypothetical protein
MGVQDASDVRVLDQDGKFAPSGKCDLPTALPQLRLNVLEAERFVDRLLARARYSLLSAAKAFLIENHAMYRGKASELIKMFFRASGEEQRYAVVPFLSVRYTARPVLGSGDVVWPSVRLSATRARSATSSHPRLKSPAGVIRLIDLSERLS